MFRGMTICLGCTLFFVGCSGDGESESRPATQTPASPATVAEVVAAMGMQGMQSITWSGSAWRVRNAFRQTRTASPPWPERDEITAYVRTLDLANPASLATGKTFASNILLDPPVEGTYTQNIPADQKAWRQQLEIWLTPWGFLRGAENLAAEASTRTVDGTTYTVISWMSSPQQTSPSGLRYSVNGYINEQKLVERVETWVEDDFMGDMHVVALFDDYRSVGGLMVPTTMEQQRGGGGVFGVTVADVRANPPNLAELLTPPPARGGGGGGGGGGEGGAAAPTNLVEALGDNVYVINGGYLALAVELEDYVVVYEAGQSEMRGQQILDEVKKTIPDKPIRYVVNSHAHADHTAGLVPFVREGAVIVTQASNVDFLSMALRTPRTLLGEPALNPQFEPVTGVRVFENGRTRLELHDVPTLHSDGSLVALLPAEGVMLTADFPLSRPGATPNPFIVALAEYIERNALNFERYMQTHGAAQTKADVMAAIGR